MRGLVKKIAPAIGDCDVQLLDTTFCLLPVGAEFGFAAQAPLQERQALLMLPVATNWRVRSSVRARSEGRYPDIDSRYRARGMTRRFNFPFGLDAHKPLAAPSGYRDVFDLAQYCPAVAVAQPAELGQEQAGVGLIELVLRAVRIAETL